MRIIALALIALGAALLPVSLEARPAAQESPWVKVYDKASNDFHAVEMFDDRLGLALAGAGIFRTDDGGQTWRDVTPDELSITFGQIAFADASRAASELGWKARLDLDAMCRDAWRWQSRNPQGYP